ncbi:MAG TPA: M13 family metallopeptidase, partial [Burkholderiaceae bacterium]|nr:M13 family metallopeptidase [Burkholderiaceae bacterium]
YVNGAWIERTVIPAEDDRVSEGSLMHDRVQARLHDLLEDAAAHAPAEPRTVGAKVGAMYAAFMDDAKIEALGMAPIRPDLEALAAAKDKTVLARAMGRSVSNLGGSIFNVSIDLDLKDTGHYAIYLNQAGLGMPDRDYYLEERFAKERAAYLAYIQAQLALAHWPDPAGAASRVLGFETAIAKASWSKPEQRDVVKMFNPMSPAELAAYAPGFPWSDFLDAAQLGAKTKLVVGEKTAFPRIATIFDQAPLATLQAWAAFNVVDSAAPFLSQPFVTARFEFRGKTLEGRAAPEPRWKRGVAAVSGGDCGTAPGDCFGTLNWAVGQLYVAQDFPPATRSKVEHLVAELMVAFHARLEKLDWMSPATRQEALRKLDTYHVKVGFPDHARDYSDVAIRRDDLVGDVRSAAAADWAFYVQRSAGPVDMTDWSMTPQTVDAYNGSLRDIVFPAAILQAPDFDPAADDAVNYGGIGAIIGHELTHGFDDQGRSIDAAGALRDWWAPEDDKAFQARTARFGAQYARFEPSPGLHINPGLTMGENIADLGGVVIALDAYHASLQGKPAPIIDGLTGDQRFFLAFAQEWRGKLRDDAIRKQTVSDPHSYRKYRVLGPLPDVDAWYQAFDVKPGDRMYIAPEDRVHIW